eukprot:ANDGO_08146.mRNA.1 Chromatin structure-remodeling complex subunit SFH1
MQDCDYVEVFDPLVPVRIGIELPDGNHLSDAFLFDTSVSDDLAGEIVSMALSLARDHGLPSTFVGVLSECIAHQTEFWRPLCSTSVPREGSVVDLRLQVRVDDAIYNDRIEWDLANGPEAVDLFVDQMARDFALDTRWACAIAIHLREKILEAKRQLRDGGVRFIRQKGGAAAALTRDEWVREPLVALDWSAQIKKLTDRELRKWEQDVLREERARRRKLASGPQGVSTVNGISVASAGYGSGVGVGAASDAAYLPPGIICDEGMANPRVVLYAGSTVRTPATQFLLQASSAGGLEGLSQQSGSQNAQMQSSALGSGLTRAAAQAAQALLTAGSQNQYQTSANMNPHAPAALGGWASTGASVPVYADGRPLPSNAAVMIRSGFASTTRTPAVYDGPLISMGVGSTMANPMLHPSMISALGVKPGHGYMVDAKMIPITHILSTIKNIQQASASVAAQQALAVALTAAVTAAPTPAPPTRAFQDKKAHGQKVLHAAVAKYRAQNPHLSYAMATTEFTGRIKTGSLRWGDYSEQECPLRMDIKKP